MSQNLGPGPASIHCSSCQKTITTTTSSELSTTGWVVSIILCVIGCWPCCLIPCCTDSMQAVSITGTYCFQCASSSSCRPPIRVLHATSLWASTLQARQPETIHTVSLMLFTVQNFKIFYIVLIFCIFNNSDLN